VLLLAVVGPVAARVSEPIADRLLSLKASREARKPSTSSPHEDCRL
jgi:hypothetical protein